MTCGIWPVKVKPLLELRPNKGVHLHSPPWIKRKVNTAFAGNTPSANWKFRFAVNLILYYWKFRVFLFRMGVLFFLCDFLMAYIVLIKVLDVSFNTLQHFLTPFHCATRLLLDCAFATCTSPIMHLICPPKFCISIVFNFSLDSCNTQEKWKTKVTQNFGGQISSIIRDVQVANNFFSTKEPKARRGIVTQFWIHWSMTTR